MCNACPPVSASPSLPPSAAPTATPTLAPTLRCLVPREVPGGSDDDSGSAGSGSGSDSGSGDGDTRGEPSVCTFRTGPVGGTITVTYESDGRGVPTVDIDYSIMPVRCGADYSTTQMSGVFHPTGECEWETRLSHADSSELTACPQTVIRLWTVTDGCGNTLFQTQTLQASAPADGGAFAHLRSPRDGALNVPTRPTLTWAEVPESVGYNVWIWDYGTPPNLVQSYTGVTGPSLTVSVALADGERFAWRVDAVSASGDITSGAEWDLTIRTLSDLVALRVEAPPVGQTGGDVVIEWAVASEERGEPLPSSTSVGRQWSRTGYLWNDGVYLSLQSDFNLNSVPPPIRVGAFGNPRYPPLPTHTHHHHHHHHHTHTLLSLNTTQHALLIQVTCVHPKPAVSPWIPLSNCISI
jgi:hypothetical protein